MVDNLPANLFPDNAAKEITTKAAQKITEVGMAIVQGEIIKRGVEKTTKAIVGPIVKKELEDHTKRMVGQKLMNTAAGTIAGSLGSYTVMEAVKRIPRIFNAVAQQLPKAKYNQGQLDGIRIGQEAVFLAFKNAPLIEFVAMMNELISINPTASGIRKVIVVTGTGALTYKLLQIASEKYVNWEEHNYYRRSIKASVNEMIAQLFKDNKIDNDKRLLLTKEFNLLKSTNQLEEFSNNLMLRAKER